MEKDYNEFPIFWDDLNYAAKARLIGEGFITDHNMDSVPIAILIQEREYENE